MSEVRDTAEALRALAHALDIPDHVVEDRHIAAFEARYPKGSISLLQAIRFFSDPHACAIVEAFLNVEDPACRRAIAETTKAIAGSFNLKRALDR